VVPVNSAASEEGVVAPAAEAALEPVEIVAEIPEGVF